MGFHFEEEFIAECLGDLRAGVIRLRDELARSTR